MVTSYGVTVQNKYSAFLEDEDGFGHAAIAPTQVAANKVANSTLNNKRSDQSKKISTPNSAQASGKQIVLSGKNNVNNKQTTGQRNPSSNNPKHNDGKHSRDLAVNRQHQETNNNHQKFSTQLPQRHNNKNGNFNHEGHANGSRTFRNNAMSNSNHNSTSDAVAPKDNDENGQQTGKFARGGNHQPRPHHLNRSHNENRRYQQNDESGNSQPFNGPGMNLEEEKRRRQHKRTLDLKHKDPEKREARRQQQAVFGNSPKDNQEAAPTQVEGNSRPPRRNNDRYTDGVVRGSGRNFAPARGRGRRGPMSDQSTNAEIQPSDTNGQTDGSTFNKGPRSMADRPPRNRNGLGTGTRGGRGFRGEGVKFQRDSERPKPIPNFSDKQDFPSLAS